MQHASIFKSPAGQQAVMDLYDEALALWPLPYETLMVSTRHGETYVIASGNPEGPPLVLLHGASSNSGIWGADVAHYGRRYRVYAVDLLGEPGRSAPSRPAWDGSAYAQWMEDVFDALKLDSAALVGISQGGWTALKFTSYRPARVQALVLLCPGGVVPDKASFFLRMLPLSLMGEWGARRITRMLFGSQPVPAEADAYITVMLQHYKPRMGKLPIFSDGDLRRLTMPTLLLMGDEDVLRDAEKMVARMSALVPHLSAAVVPGAGHVLLDTAGPVNSFLDRSVR